MRNPFKKKKVLTTKASTSAAMTGAMTGPVITRRKRATEGTLKDLKKMGY